MRGDRARGFAGGGATALTRQNLGAVGWNLTAAQMAQLDAASAMERPYPYWHQGGFEERNPSPVPSPARGRRARE